MADQHLLSAVQELLLEACELESRFSSVPSIECEDFSTLLSAYWSIVEKFSHVVGRFDPLPVDWCKATSQLVSTFAVGVTSISGSMPSLGVGGNHTKAFDEFLSEFAGQVIAHLSWSYVRDCSHSWTDSPREVINDVFRTFMGPGSTADSHRCSALWFAVSCVQHFRGYGAEMGDVTSRNVLRVFKWLTNTADSKTNLLRCTLYPSSTSACCQIIPILVALGHVTSSQACDATTFCIELLARNAHQLPPVCLKSVCGMLFALSFREKSILLKRDVAIVYVRMLPTLLRLHRMGHIDDESCAWLLSPMVHPSLSCVTELWIGDLSSLCPVLSMMLSWFPPKGAKGMLRRCASPLLDLLQIAVGILRQCARVFDDANSEKLLAQLCLDSVNLLEPISSHEVRAMHRSLAASYMSYAHACDAASGSSRQFASLSVYDGPDIEVDVAPCVQWCKEIDFQSEEFARKRTMLRDHHRVVQRLHRCIPDAAVYSWPWRDNALQ